MNAPRPGRATAVMLAATLVYILAVIQRGSPPVVALDIMADLGFTPDHLSLMFAATMVAYGLMQPVAGFWADRFGPRRCLVGAGLGLGLGSIIFSLAQGLVVGLSARMLVGLAAGLALMPCLKLAGHWFSPKRFGLVSSIIVAAAALANFAVGRPLAQSAAAFGWRWSFMGLGIAGLLLAVAVFLVIRDRPPLAEAPEPEAPAWPPEEAAPTPTFFQSLRLIAREPEFWLLALLYAGTDMLYATFTGLWAGPYLIEVHGQTEAAVGNMLSVAAAGFLVGPPLLVWWATMWRSYGRVLLCLALADVLIALVLVWAEPGLSSPALYFLCFIAPVGAQGACLIFVLVRNLFPENLAASSMGLINVFPIIPGALMQKIVGHLLTQAEDLNPMAAPQELYSQAFQPLLIYMIISVPLALWQVRKERVGPLSFRR